MYNHLSSHHGVKGAQAHEVPPSQHIQQAIHELLEAGMQGNKEVLGKLVLLGSDRLVQEVLEQKVVDVLGRRHYEHKYKPLGKGIFPTSMSLTSSSMLSLKLCGGQVKRKKAYFALGLFLLMDVEFCCTLGWATRKAMRTGLNSCGTW